MKIPSFKIKDNNNNKAKTNNKKFVCKECKMSFQSKDPLGLQKRKSKHFTGFLYLGKNDG
jgi:transposase-like protein